jgi:hypothetical protein
MPTQRENIKFYLETVTATLVSIMAVLVALSQCVISSEQNKLLKVQTEIAKRQILPTFIISAHQFKEHLSDYYSEDKISIENKGFSISGFHCEVKTFFIAKLSHVKKMNKTARIPVNGYYGSMALTARGDGLLATIFGYENNLKASKFKKSFMEYCEKKDEIGLIEIKRSLVSQRLIKQ